MGVNEMGKSRKAVLAGGSGFLGQALARALLADGWQVVVLSRDEGSVGISGKVVAWDGRSAQSGWVNELEGAEVLVNLTGRSIDCRFSPVNRASILDSRILSTRALGMALKQCKNPPDVWLNASSMALYGQRWGDSPACDENSSTDADGFLEEVTRVWEREFFSHSFQDLRQVALRIGFVLGRSGGALPLLSRLARFGLGGAQGSGRQWMSWLHQDDWVGATRFLIDRSDLSGPINLSSPQPVTNADFMRAIRRRFAPLGIGVPAPAFAVRLGCFLLGSAPELALQSRKVIPGLLKSSGYRFRFGSSLDQAFVDLSRSICR